jgi:GntR family histidine utilization transcriptional repressor
MSGPLHERIRAELEAPIRAGEWRPGHRIPFEHELVARFGCSRATVNKAVSALAAAGLIERRKRAGSFVCRPPLHGAMLAIPDIAEAVEGRGEAYRFQLLRRETRQGEASQDGIAGHAHLALTGLHLANECSLAHETRLISLVGAPEAEHADVAGRAPGSWLLENVTWSSATHRVSAVRPTVEVARGLSITTVTPCLQIERSTWRGDVPVTAVTQVFPGYLYDLVGRFTS